MRVGVLASASSRSGRFEGRWRGRRFERVRFARLKHFDRLVTMDVFSHMKGVHAAGRRASNGDDVELPPWPTPGSHSLDEPYYPAERAAAAPRAGGDGGVLAEELLMHRGIYARLGTYARKRRRRVRGQAVPHVDGHMELQVRGPLAAACLLHHPLKCFLARTRCHTHACAPEGARARCMPRSNEKNGAQLHSLERLQTMRARGAGALL